MQKVEAYKEQAKHYPPGGRPIFAIFISEKYDLKITPDAALELLMEE